jgi:hypothetical protein
LKQNHKEKTMKTQPVPNPMLARSPEPFEEVWMFPEGWDLSEMEKSPVGVPTAQGETFPVDRLVFLRTDQTV